GVPVAVGVGVARECGGGRGVSLGVGIGLGVPVAVGVGVAGVGRGLGGGGHLSVHAVAVGVAGDVAVTVAVAVDVGGGVGVGGGWVGWGATHTYSPPAICVPPAADKSSPHNHFVAGPNCRVIVAGGRRVSGGSRDPTIRIRTVPAARVQTSWIRAAPDDHFSP